MTTIERSILINASYEQIADIMNDGRRLPEWYAGIDKAEPDDLYPEVGGVVDIVYKVAGMTFNVKQTSLEFNPGIGGKNQMEGMITGITTLSFATEGDQTKVTMGFDYEMPGGSVGKVFDRLMVERMNGQNLEKSLANLKALAEA